MAMTARQIHELNLKTCTECGKRLRETNTNVCRECLEKVLADLEPEKPKAK
jgi:DNA-directed RNA polymerase subunit RPC12/RpoP